MTPVSFSDDQLETVLTVAKVVPPRLRRKYLREVAARLSADGDVERAVNAALTTLDESEKT
jgi:hypothetical protein